MVRADENNLARRMPNAAWAWEGLRRNPDYRRAYFSARHKLPTAIKLYSGATLLRAKRRDREAEFWGLLSLTDPRFSAKNTEAFWRPDLLAGSLEVRLSPLTQAEQNSPQDYDIISLSGLQTRRLLLETVDGGRHILLNGSRFWIQLYCPNPSIFGECAHVGIRLNYATHMKRCIDTATQLLSLYRSEGGQIGLIGRRRNTDKLRNAIIAHDVWTGFERPKGGLRDIAISIFGRERVEKDWSGPSRYLKDQAVRSRNKGLAFVAKDYRSLLTRKSV